MLPEEPEPVEVGAPLPAAALEEMEVRREWEEVEVVRWRESGGEGEAAGEREGEVEDGRRGG